MKRFTRSLLSLCLALLLCAALLPGSARADGETAGGTTAPASASSRYLVTGYNAHTSAITINQSASIDITLSCIEGTGVPARVVRGVDNFRFGDATVPVYDAATQLDQVENLITQGCDAIIAYAFDNQAIASSAKEVEDAGIPFILWDRDMAEGASPAADLFVGLDTYNQAYLAGKAFFQDLKDKGVEATDIISIMGATNDNNALNRQKGFEDAAAEFGLTIAQTVPSDWDAEKALTGFTAAFQAHPDCNVVLIASDFIVTAVQTVLEANDAWFTNSEEGHIWICSQDGFPTGVKFMQEGYMDYSGMYNVDGMCENFANAVYDLIDGTYSGESKLYTDPMIVAAADINNLDLWGAHYMDEAA